MSNYCLENFKKRQCHQYHLHILQHGVNDGMFVYLDSGAIGKARHHYQGQAGLQREGFLQGLASYCKAESTFTFHFSILTL